MTAGGVLHCWAKAKRPKYAIILETDQPISEWEECVMSDASPNESKLREGHGRRAQDE